MIVHRGEIYYADLSPVVGSEQGGVRPVLIVQNDVGNKFSPTVIAAAITSQKDKANLPTHIAVNAQGSGLKWRGPRRGSPPSRAGGAQRLPAPWRTYPPPAAGTG